MTTDRSARGAGPRPMAGSFEDFVHASGPGMHRTALLLCGDDRLAADLTRTTYAQAFARWRRVRRTRDPVAHTRAIMTRTYLSERCPGGTGEVPGGPVAAPAAAEGAAVDLHQLVRDARREGMRLRRYRQALTTVGSATVLSARRA